MKEEDEDLVYKQATTTIRNFRLCADAGLSLELAEEDKMRVNEKKESVAGTTMSKETRTVDRIDDAGLSLELADEQQHTIVDGIDK